MQGNISQNKLQLMKKNFNLVDKNKDNKIDTEEFKILMQLLGQTKTEKEMDEIVDKHFEDDNGDKDTAEDDGKSEIGKSDNGITNGGKSGGGASLPASNLAKQKSCQKNAMKVAPNHDRIKNLIAKLNNFNDDEKKKKSNNNELMKKKKKHIDFETFMKIFINTYTEPISLDELIKSFEFFDNEKSGYIDEEKLRFIIKNTDERLMDDDMKLFLNSLNFRDKDKIDYVMLAKRLKNVT
ncbi:calmodulin [Plasmodium gonderi]|uniref:Calmodulin n=1 Tax=Plasmodium gonderi TaxID=77519 RepID=A0A1Y1JEB2_PLAGO|nr:calmodulin [Plasmodium gonderi]GAW80008.1 calmodulin [Plasmodium gonderi]